MTHVLLSGMLQSVLHCLIETFSRSPVVGWWTGDPRLSERVLLLFVRNVAHNFLNLLILGCSYTKGQDINF